jgi:hypothetical protein
MLEPAAEALRLQPVGKSDKIGRWMKVFPRLLIALVCLLTALPSLQAQPTAPANGLPSITFNLNWNQGRPWVDYTITVSENGATHFSGKGNPADGGDGEAVQRDFTMTEANRQKIFEWAKAANYFEGEYETRQKNVAKTGTKTLEYHSSSVNHSTTFNYSPNQNIQQLSKLFQSIATTLDFGSKLTFQYRFDKLGMDACLQQLTDLQASGFVEELQAIEPILRKIAEDTSLMHIARTQAKQLLKATAGNASVASKPGT